MPASTRNSRRGAAYLVALLAGSIVTVTGLAALSMTTSRARTTSMADHAARARSLTRSGMEHAKCAIATHLDNGGTRHTIFGAAEPSVTFGGGTFGWSLRKMDGTAVDNSDQPVLLRAKSEHGPARYAMQAILAPSGVPYDVLDTGLYVSGELRLNTTGALTSDKVVGSITEVFATTAVIDAPVESAGSVHGALYLGTTSPNVAARRMPDPSLIDYYVALGERINLGSLPTTAGAPTLERVLLSPSSNPFGNTNELGIYIIDCAGGNLVVRNLRVAGTLVLLNATGTAVMGQKALLQPAYDWMPSLLVQGNLTFQGTILGPSEADLGVNLNPPHTPFGFQYDADLADDYAARITGVSYISGDAAFTLPRQNIAGTMIVGGTARIYAGVIVDITYDPSVATMPPYGFFEDTGGLAIDPSTVVWSTPF